ncbi:MAG: lysophospholipid acyltransferase family protein [Candidatus Rokubacteria bacterium]|nr:lysophospholipid acyltransferase family protein [Candidatus Rokubacteria bacterium]
MSRRRRRAPPVPAALRWTDGVLARLVEAVAKGVGRLPPATADRLGRGLGALAYRCLGRRRAIALQNLAIAFGDRAPGELRDLARRSFQHLGVTAAECCRLFFGPPGLLLGRVQVEGLPHLKAAMAQERGALLLSAHFGNWELLAAAHVLTGYPLSVVIRPLDSPALEAVLARCREGVGLQLIPKREALRGVVTALARGGMVGVLLDQNATLHEGVFVPFFGRLASTSKGLALLAQKTGAPVVPVLIRREPDGTHRVTVDPPVPLQQSGDREADVLANTAAFTRIIERHVLAHPEQWFWVHRRWKTRPPDEG